MIFLMLFAIPMVIALAAEYGFCRFSKRWEWQCLPPLLTAVAAGTIAFHRYHGWSAGAEKAPWETLLFIPGIPALGAFLGLWLGWRLWRRLWLPRIVKDPKKGE